MLFRSIHANDRLGAILLSNPNIIDISSLDESVKVGSIYNPNLNSFTDPE